MDPAVVVEQQLALEDVERLLERVDVALQPAARVERAERELRVDGALARSDEHLPGEPLRAVGRRHGVVRERPVDMSDEVHGPPSACSGRMCDGARLRTGCSTIERPAVKT